MARRVDLAEGDIEVLHIRPIALQVGHPVVIGVNRGPKEAGCFHAKEFDGSGLFYSKGPEVWRKCVSKTSGIRTPPKPEVCGKGPGPILSLSRPPRVVRRRRQTGGWGCAPRGRRPRDYHVSDGEGLGSDRRRWRAGRRINRRNARAACSSLLAGWVVTSFRGPAVSPITLQEYPESIAFLASMALLRS